MDASLSTSKRCHELGDDPHWTRTAVRFRKERQGCLRQPRSGLLFPLFGKSALEMSIAPPLARKGQLNSLLLPGGHRSALE
jgi:hypothetical protein